MRATWQMQEAKCMHRNIYSNMPDLSWESEMIRVSTNLCIYSEQTLLTTCHRYTTG